MLTTRVIPLLLLKGRGLYKTVRFQDPRYVGDPINAVRIFNDKEVDEIAIVEMGATREGREPAVELMADIASEAFMPLSYGGGIHTPEQARALFKLGIEKVAVNTHAVRDPDFIRQLSDEFGSQSIVVSIDVARRRGYEVMVTGGTQATGLDPVAHAERMQTMGAGEILLTSIERDGTGSGYDLDLVTAVSAAVDVPVIASGGAGTAEHFSPALAAGAAAVAAGSMFVFRPGRHRAVLISYLSPAERAQVSQARST